MATYVHKVHAFNRYTCTTYSWKWLVIMNSQRGRSLSTSQCVEDNGEGGEAEEGH